MYVHHKLPILNVKQGIQQRKEIFLFLFALIKKQWGWKKKKKNTHTETTSPPPEELRTTETNLQESDLLA